MTRGIYNRRRMRFLCSLGREEDKPIYSPSKPEQLLFLWPFPTWPSAPAACRPLTLRAPRCSELCLPLVLWAGLLSLSPSCLLTLLDLNLPKCLHAPCQVLGKISFAQRQGLPLGFPPICAVNWGLLHLTWRWPGRRRGSSGPPSLPPAALETSSVLSLDTGYLRSG